jgi:hypothetical protein
MTTRWIFHDPVASTSWTVPRNPIRMNFPSPRRSIDTLPADRNGKIAAMMTPPTPVEVSFEGTLTGQTHHDTLLAWTRKSNQVTITDHLARPWTVLLTSFEPTWKAGRPANYRGEYVVKGLLLD